ncbi:LamG-like jellyroll fold domain-containing protein [Patescibacteria group bacterium]
MFLWINPTQDFNSLGSGLSYEQIFISKSPTNGAEEGSFIFKIDTDTDKLQFGAFDNAGDVVVNIFGTNTSWNANQWYQIAITFNGAGYEVYLDGQSDGYTTDSDSFGSTDQTYYIGRAGNDVNPQYFDGLIDSVRIYNRALTANEIRAHYDLGSHIQDGDMEDASGSRVVGEWNQSSEGAELLTNGGFETAGGGGADVWGTWAENAGDGGLANETSIKYAGSDAASTTAGSLTDTFVKQAAAVTTGNMYKATFYTRGDGTYSGQYAIWDATNDAVITATTTAGITGTTYTKFTKYFTAPSSCASVDLHLYAPSTEGGTAYFDDASVIAAQVASPESGIVRAEDGLVGGWNFSGTSGTSADGDTLTDVSGNSNDGTGVDGANNTGLGFVSGRFGTAIEFDGVDDYVDCGTNSSLLPNIFTAIAWVKYDGSQTDAPLITWATTQPGIYIEFLNVGPLIYIGVENFRYFEKDSPVDVFNNKWHQLAFVVTGNAQNDIDNSKLYVDDREQDIRTTNNTGTPDTKTFLRIGVGHSNYFNGAIDSVRVYNRALSAGEIVAHYSSTRGKFGEYSAKIKLVDDNSNSYLDEILTDDQDYLLSYWYKAGEDNANPINFTASGTAIMLPEQNIMASSTTGLVGAWNFEEAATPSVDVSGNGHSLTWNGTAAKSTSGKFANAIDLDGDSDYLNKTDSDSLDLASAATISAWVYLDDLAAQHCIADKGTNYGVHIDTSGYLTWDNGTEYKDTTAIAATTWTHAVVVNDGTTASYYINGTYSSNDTAGFAAINASDLRIGYDGTNYYQGLIDNLRIYNKALTASEVYESYKAGDWRQYELSFEADAGVAGVHAFSFIQDGTTAGNSIVYVDNFRLDKNLADKGSFEAFSGGDPDIPTGWVNESLSAGEGDEGDEEIHSGSKSFELIDADDGEGIMQGITVTSGNWYTFGMWAKNNNQDVEAIIGGTALASTTIDLTTAGNIWTKFNKTFIASSTDLAILISAGAATQDGYFDDVSLVELDSYSGAATATTTTPSSAANSYSYGRWGESSGSLMMDGGDTLTYPTANNMYADQGSFSFWIKPSMDYDDYAENKYLWDVSDGTNNAIRLYYNYSDYKFYFEIYDGASWTSVQAASSAQSFTEDTWIHLAGTWNDRKNLVYLYVNGANDGSSDWGWYAQTLPTNMYFGSDYSGTNNADMYIDDLRVYEYALSAEDISRMYGSLPDPSADNLRVSIPFTSGGIGIDGTGLFDLTGTFTAGWGYRTGKVSGENAMLFAGSDDLQFSRGDQLDGNIYEYISPYQGTIKTWVRSGFDGSDSTTNYIFQNGSTSYIKLYSSSGTLYFDIATTTGAVISRVSNDISGWTAGEWHHIAAVWSNENTVSTSSTQYLMELYVDTAIAGNTYTNATFNTNFWASFAPGTSFIGEDSDSANQWDGLIGGFVLENRAWSGNEVSDDYNSGTGTAVAVNQSTIMSLPFDSADLDGLVTWATSTQNVVADWNMEDGDAGEWTDTLNASSSAESGIVTAEDGLVGGWNFEDDLTDDSGNSKTGVSHTDPDCPTGYVFVPGNSTYSTSDFCVMQYEAKYDSNDDGTGDDAPTECKYNTDYDTWDWGKDVATECGYDVNETARVVSTAAGSPIAGITHTEALSACPSGDHIITNDEWMTIARDAEQVNANWTGGEVGSGCLFAGNNGDATCGYNGDDPEKGTGRNARAKFILSSGEEVYDISGNVWEHVKVDASDTLIDDTPTDGGAAEWRWIEFTAITGYGDLSYDQIRPSNSSWNADQGMGRLYTYNGVSSNRVFLRGGMWSDDTNAGAFTLSLNWTASTQHYTVGVRCAR